MLHHRNRLTTMLAVHQEGTAILEAALLMPFLTFVLAGAVDVGRVAYAAIEVQTASHAAAMYGAQYPSDANGMIAAAQAAAPDVPGLTVTSSGGCECSDGSSPSAGCTSTPTCSYNVVHYVQIDAMTNSYPLLLFPSLAQSFPLHAMTRVRTTF